MRLWFMYVVVVVVVVLVLEFGFGYRLVWLVNGAIPSGGACDNLARLPYDPVHPLDDTLRVSLARSG